MSLPLIVVVWPYGFRAFDWDRLELSQLQQNAEVVVHDLVRALTPHFAKVHEEKLYHQKVIYFGNLKNWIIEFKKLEQQKHQQIIILNFVRLDSLKHFFVNWVLKKSKKRIIDYYQPGIPSFARKLKFLGKLKKVFNKDSFYAKYNSLRANLFFHIGQLLKLNPDFRMIAGSHYEQQQKPYCELKGIQIIRGNTWDYSRILRTKCQRIVPIKYAVFLDGAGPMFSSDSLLARRKIFFTKENWYPSLSSFFDALEKKSNLKILIAPHPGTVHPKFPEYFGGREVIEGKTLDLVANSEFVITRQSTAISYAIQFEKPIFFIYSDELLLDEDSMRKIMGMASKLGTKAVNINDMDSVNLRQLCFVHFNKYQEFKEQYLTSRMDSKPNCQILLDEVVG